MNVAVVIAGGKGVRTGQDVPKQFLNVYDVPIFIYTLHNLETLDCIDEIIVVGPEGWENYISSYAKQFGIRKMKATVLGGETRYHSILNGLMYLKEHNYPGETVVAVTDANRPLVPHRVIRDCIQKLDDCACAIPLEPCYDSMFRCRSIAEVDGNEDRSQLFAGQTPETTRLKDVLAVYERAEQDQLTDYPVNALFVHYGIPAGGVPGSKKCMKITTVEDFELFRALLGDFRISGIKAAD